MFDERLVRNQDDEFNYRIRRAGGKILRLAAGAILIFRPRARRTAVQAVFSVRLLAYSGHRETWASHHAAPDGANAVLPGMCASRVGGLWWREPLLAVGTAGHLRDRASARGRCQCARGAVPGCRRVCPSRLRRCMPATRWGWVTACGRGSFMATLGNRKEKWRRSAVSQEFTSRSR